MLKPLKLLHTSDWHLGRRLYGHTRYEEFSAFLDWLYDCIVEQEIDILIVAGDIFDTMTPSNKAQSLYYQFLGRISTSVCQHVIIVAGNHDSPSLLDAPKSVLKFLDVHIIGTACDPIEEEVITLTNQHGEPQAIVLAVPYLRDKDIRHSQSGESSMDKQAQVVAGITKHYAQVSKIAKARQKSLSITTNAKTTTDTSCPDNNQGERKMMQRIPLVATGHLMAIGGKTTADDGVRDLYIGSLGGISASIFDPEIDYVALGHLHVPQKVGGEEHIRYSGSPIAMGFGEANQQKQVLVVEFAPISVSAEEERTIREGVTITAIEVPTFHKLAQVKGDMSEIQQQIDILTTLDEPVWVEVIYQSTEVISNLSAQLSELVTDSQVEIIKIKNTQTYQRVLKQTSQTDSLHDLSHTQVFERCLDAHDIADNQRAELMACFQQVVYDIEHQDVRAE